jgi:hypothetical protein
MLPTFQHSVSAFLKTRNKEKRSTSFIGLEMMVQCYHCNSHSLFVFYIVEAVEQMLVWSIWI